MDTLGTKIIVLLVSEVYFFQEKNSYVFRCEVETQSSVLIKQGVLISEVPFKRCSTVASLPGSHEPPGACLGRKNLVVRHE